MRRTDPFATGLFPVCVATHDHGLRQLFDLSTLLLLLDCRPGDRVLDIGAGSGFSSEMLARLGYSVIALDPDLAALGHNRRRPGFDRERIDGTVQVVQGVAEQLPFNGETFDGIVAMNVLHHVADLSTAVKELARVLRPGRRAVLCEPGLEHLDHADTKRAVRELGESDQPFDVIAFLALSRQRGFAEAMLTATVQPPLRLLPIEEIDVFLTGAHPRKPLTAHGVLEELHKRHAYAMLVRDGRRVKTSRHPGVLRCEFRVSDLAHSVNPGEVLTVTAEARNLGDTIWLCAPSPLGGYVTAGCKLMTEEGRLITNELPRAFLSKDVPPGHVVSLEMTIPLPADLSPGRYQLHFDLVDELVCWFSDLTGEPGATHVLTVKRDSEINGV